jgi:ABC-2 type transport system ATP-binding protein
MTFLDVRQLRKSFNGQVALSGLSFCVERGEVYGLVGPNGAGKTTAINIICGLLAADEGAVTVDGEPASAATRRRMGITPQAIALYRDLTAEHNLSFFAGLYGLNREARQRRVAECLRAVGLEERAASRVEELSGGMLRRLHIAVALLHGPPLIILDEPSVGLDLETRRRVWDVIRGLKLEGRAILLTTHRLEEAELHCTRIGVLADGELAAEGSMEELRALIPAAQLAVIEAADLAAVRQRAADRGLECRSAAAAVTVWLPRVAQLGEVAGYFSGIPLSSISLKPVSLEEVFAEVTSPSAPPNGSL